DHRQQRPARRFRYRWRLDRHCGGRHRGDEGRR
ncbi:MAG: hypothetical protein AVDCRST_MAG60-2117, partial [uncultured Nocardioides sp.]